MLDLNHYDGGKGLVFRNIINEMPPHDIFVSGFAGGCAAARNKRPARVNVLVDKDKRVIDAWCSMLVKNNEGIPSSELTRGARAADIIRIDEPAASPELTRLASSIKNDEVTRWILIHGCFLDVLPYLPISKKTAVYLDPPYLMTTRSYQKRPLYRHEFSTLEEHERLLLALLGLECRVLLSGYGSGLYGRFLGDWRRVDYWTVNRAGTRVRESLWCNFAEPVRLHDYRYLGDGWRERDRIKQKTKRWVRRFDGLPVLERRAILGALEERGLLD